MRSFLLFVFLSFSFIQLHGQSQCETEFTLENKKHFDELVRQAELDFSKGPDDIIEVPIVFYIETYNGTPVYNAANLNTVISQNNTYYATANVEFSICTVILFENGTIPERIEHVIRVKIKTSYSGCGVSYGGGNITINPNCSRPFKEILAHELGHALGLPHTHGYTNSGTTTELVDGSNCTTDGDRFCDTPADPNILGEVNSSCIYYGTRTDANGDSYNPDTHNMMSYTRGGCPNHFSSEQNARIHNVAEAKAYYCCLAPEPETADVSVCSGNTATITATIASGEIRWYDAPGGNLLYTGNSFTTPVLNATDSYFLYGFEGCESDPVKVTARVLPGGGVLSNIAERLTQLGNDTTFSSIDNIIDADSMLYFRLNYRELWSFAGEPGSEQLVFSVGAGAGGDGGNGGNTANLTSFAKGSNKLLLGVNDQIEGPSLYVSDGTAGGTELLIEWGGNDYRYSNFWITELNGSFIFELTRLPDENAEIWISDGTVAGTQLVISLPNTSSFSINRFYNYNGKLYFKAASTLYDLEPWVTDGTAAGTYLLKEVNTTGSANPENFIEHNGMLYFIADDGINGIELWKTDGTEENTTRVTDINPDGSTYISSLKSIDNYLYFSANNGLIGNEPYYTDGTVFGTALIEDIDPSFGSTPHSFTKCNGSVYFLASSVQGEIGDLYQFNPISNELNQVKEFSISGSNYTDLVCYNNQLYFSSASEQNNFEPWISDGTENGTVQWLDLNPVGSSRPGNFIPFNEQLVFIASDSTGRQFYRAAEENYHVCNGETATITTQNYTGTVSWYDAAVDGNLLGTGYSFQTAALSDSVSFWADLTVEGCTSERTEIPVAVTTIELDASITHETNPADGAINLTVSGGVPPYQFDWNTDGSGDFDDEEDLSNLVPGTYEVTVIDSSGCMSVASFEVFSVPKLFIGEIINIDCFGNNNGSIQISIDGGTAPFEYSWSNGAITEDISGLVAGLYTLEVTDSNGLIAVVDIEITQPDELLATSEITQMITCFDAGNGAFEILTQGGAEPYLYAVNEGNFSADNIFSNLDASEYIYYVEDANGCSFTDSLEITQPDSLAINNLLITHNPCPGQAQGTVDFNASGGTSPYIYQLNGLPVDLPVVGLATGDYSLDVIDANGCIKTIALTIDESNGVIFNADIVSEPTCNGFSNGIVSLNVSDGVAPFQWSVDGVSFNNFPTGSSVTSILNLGAGTIDIVVLDANGCESIQTVLITEPDEMLANANQMQFISCFGGNDAIVAINALGGTPPYMYSFFGQAFDLNNILENISAGNHTYTVMDANDCLFVGEFTVFEPEALDFFLEIVNEIGNDPGSIDLTVIGGTPPYSYDWDNDGTGDYDDTEDLENLNAGTYTVNVLDINNCGFSASAEVEFLVGINQAGVLSEINVYPNPTADNLIIDFGKSYNDQVNIRVYNSLGEVVYQKNNFSDDRLEIDLTNESPGVYLLKIFAENDLLVKQIIKQ